MITQVRQGEVTTTPPAATDAGLFFIGVIRTPWRETGACPRRGNPLDGPDCRIDVFDIWRPALDGVDKCDRVEVLYWMHLARRDLVLQHPKSRGHLFGTFALRSPMRPNPVASSHVEVLSVDAGGLTVRGLDCVDGTPLIDLRPLFCPLWRREGGGCTA